MKRILLLCVAALLLAVVVAVSTRVLSSDAAAFTTGGVVPAVLTLRLGGSGAQATGPNTAGFGASGLVPGSILGPAIFSLTNTGSEAGDHVEIAFHTTFTDNPTYDVHALGPNIVDMNTQIVVTDLTYGPVSLLAKTGGAFADPTIRAADKDHDGVLTMAELDGIVLRDLAPPVPGGSVRRFVIAAKVPESTGNGIQGDRAATTLTFRLCKDPAENLAFSG